MKINLTGRKATWLVLLLIALLPLPSIFSYMQRYVVRNGIVTAYLYQVKAPIDGVVHDLSVAPGTAPAAGDGSAVVLTLGSRRNTGRHEHLARELGSLEDALQSSRDVLAQYVATVTRDIDKSLAIQKAKLAAAEASLKECGQRRQRILNLVQKSESAQEDADKVEAEYRDNEAQVRALTLEIDQLRHRRAMLARGLFPQDLSDGLLQAQSHINALELNILATKRRMAEAEIATGEAGLPDALNERLAQAAVVAPDGAVIWDVNVQNGMEVSKGDRLLSYIDRSRLMVEVAVDDATLELIEPGHPVKVRLFGRSDFIPGVVSRVMGSGGVWRSDQFAAAVKNRSPREGRVLVEFSDQQLYSAVEKFCGVGRTAYAEFEGIGLLEQYFGSFLR